MDDMNDEVHEPTILEYARYHGLAADSSLYNDDDVIANLLAIAAEEAFELSDDEDAGMIDGNDDFLNEKLSVDVEARKLLASVFELQRKKTVEPDLDIRRTKFLRLEEPLLLTDPQQDVKRILAAQTQQEEFDVTKIPTMKVDLDEEADLPWPTDHKGFSDEYEKLIKEEKLEVSREAFLLLQQTRALQMKQKNVPEVYDIRSKRQQRIARQPITPPLSAPPSPVPPPRTSSPISKACLAPWEITPSTTGARRTIDKLMQEDNDMMMKKLRVHFEDDVPTSELDHLYSPLRKKAVEQSMSSSPPRPKLQALRVEPPLSPAYRREPLHSDPFSKDNLPFWGSPSDLSSDADLKKLFDEVIEPAALKVQERIDNEKPHEADATKRVKVPELTFETSALPWIKPYCKEEEDQELQKIMLPIAKSNLHYLPIAKLEKELTWSVYPRSKLDTNFEEEITDRGLVESFIKLDLDDCVRRDTLTWKPEGLRILDRDDDEEELEVVEEVEKPQPQRALADGVEMDPASVISFLRTGSVPCARQEQSAATIGSTSVFQAPHGQESQQQQSMVSTTNFLDFSTLLGRTSELQLPLAKPAVDQAYSAVPSAADELDRFLGIQNQHSKRRKLDHHGSRHTHSPSAVTPALPPVKQDTRTSHFTQPELNETFTDTVLVPTPDHLPRRQVIASTKITTNMPLFRQLAKLYPNLDIIERDYTVSVQNNETSHRASLVFSSSPNPIGQPAPQAQTEADITLSPTSGIIVTPFARLHQKPLPGSVPNTKMVSGYALRTLISNLAIRYTRLIVLVSSSSTSIHEVSQLDKRDAAALASFKSFTSSLSGLEGDLGNIDIEVMLVSNGAEPLARLLVNIVAEAPLLSEILQEIELKGDESPCETWLRNAGLNPWVAQILNAHLVGDDDGNTEAEADARIEDGLVALKTCSQDQRCEWLASVLGDEGLVVKVASVIIESL